MAGLYDDRIVGLKEQKEFARRLREQQQEPAGQMVSGWYVPNTGGAVVNALRNVLGAYQEHQADEELKGVERERAKDIANVYAQMGVQAPESLLKQAGTEEIKPGMIDRFTALLRGEEAKGTPAQPYQQPALAQNVSPDQYEAGLINLSSLSPDHAQLAGTLYNARQSRELAKAEREYAHGKDIRDQEWKQKTYEETRADRLARESADRDLRAAIAGNRNAPSPVQVIDPTTGQPIYVRPEQAYGMKPFTAQTLKQDVAEANKEQQQNQATLSTQQVLDQAAILNSHPGRLAGTGASSWVSNIPGTDAKGFQSNLDTFKAQTFLPMVSALRGLGALSNDEGKKLTDAVGALDPAMPEEEFQSSLKATTKFLYDKAKAAGLNVVMPDFGGQPEKQRDRFKQTPAQGGFSIRQLPG